MRERTRNHLKVEELLNIRLVRNIHNVSSKKYIYICNSNVTSAPVGRGDDRPDIQLPVPVYTKKFNQ